MRHRKRRLPEDFKVRVHIRRKDIRQGIAHSCYKCPGAIALLRAVRKHGFNEVAIGHFSATIWPEQIGEREMWHAVNPDVLRLFTWDFDEYKPVRPIRFTLHFVKGDAEFTPGALNN